MSLPEIKFPTFFITIPSTQEKVLFRGFLVLEEKILLTGQQSEDTGAIVHAVSQVIRNCCLDSKFDLDKITTFDFDYIFIRLRSQSVNNIIEVKYTEEDEEYIIKVELDKVIVPVIDQNMVIEVDDKIKMKLKYPSMKEVNGLVTGDISPNTDVIDLLVTKCIATVYDSETVYEFTEEELIKWFDTIPTTAYTRLTEFLNEMPSVTYTATYDNAAGETKEVVLRGIQDFFTFA